MPPETRIYCNRLLLITAVAGYALFCGACAGGPSYLEKLHDKEDTVVSRSVQTSDCSLDEAAIVLYPSEVDGLRFTGLKQGEEAMAMFRDFLGSEYKIKGTSVISYSGASDELIFWIMEFWDENEALTVLEKMNNRISGSPSFCEQESYCPKEAEVFYARYTGEETPFEHNFYYRDANRVYWVSMRGERPLDKLESFLGKV